MVTALASAAPSAVSAQAANNVLRVARGAASGDVKVYINRAIVLESAQRFVEVSIANPEIADVAALSDQTIYILGKAPGATTLTLLGDNGRLITNVDVRVTPDLSEFKQRLREVLPGEPIEVREANGGMVLSGAVSGARKVETAMSLARAYSGDNVANLMNVGGTQQVMLKIRFAEMQRSASKSLGFNINAVFGGGDVRGVARSGSNLGTTIDRAVGNTVGVPSEAFGLGRLIYSAGGVFLDVLLNALEQQGVARTLAEPNLVALSGDTAQFLAGGEVPIPIAGQDGEITVEFKPFGVGLSFTPTVVDDDLINLELETEVSAIDTSIQVVTNGISVSGFTTRRASTTVELRDGQSIAIAGLLQENFTDGKSQVPFLGDIPVLGTLFRSANFQRNQTELVIIVTPVLVTPVDGEQLELPTDRVQLPNEDELFLLGKLEGDSPTHEVAAQGLDGAIGYVLE
ncbi:type II and III secretion system protein family protein [Pikeienuella piscinae]|uniref:Type II and III secretion system protein family protein n=2 Tax=Pikeienuella piscinae TaxID=2748098 RepID=A0A7M3T7I5_9RHOB|nr:type II and III secretion system protein family protein [Pikeienuella piscinae]